MSLWHPKFVEYPLDTFIVLEVFFFSVLWVMCRQSSELGAPAWDMRELVFTSCVKLVFATGSVSSGESMSRWQGEFRVCPRSAHTSQTIDQSSPQSRFIGNNINNTVAWGAIFLYPCDTDSETLRRQRKLKRFPGLHVPSLQGSLGRASLNVAPGVATCPGHNASTQVTSQSLTSTLSIDLDLSLVFFDLQMSTPASSVVIFPLPLKIRLQIWKSASSVLPIMFIPVPFCFVGQKRWTFSSY